MTKKTEATFANDVAGTKDTTTSKLVINHGDCTTTYGFDSDKMSFSGKGKAYDADGWKVDTTGAFETNQEENTWKASFTSDISGDLGGAKMGMNVSTWQTASLLTAPFVIAPRRVQRKEGYHREASPQH